MIIKESSRLHVRYKWMTWADGREGLHPSHSLGYHDEIVDASDFP